MAQTRYSFQQPQGGAGGLFDISPYAADSRSVGEAKAGALKFGMGTVQGARPGSEVVLPKQGTSPALFEGILLNSHAQQMDMQGKTQLEPGQPVSVLRWGRAWARIEGGITTEYGQRCWLIARGESAGLFTNRDLVAAEGFAVKARFIGGPGAGDTAPVELFNQLAE